MNDLSLIQEFVQEAREYIEEVEPTLIELYQGSDELGEVDPELINSVFRLFHSMKGSAGFLALNTVTSVTHEAETLLDMIRKGQSSLTVQITETLCEALDLFREMLETIEETGEDNGFETQAEKVVRKLVSFSQADTPTEEPAAEAPSESATEDQEKEMAALTLSPEMRTGFVQEATDQIDGSEQAMLQVLEGGEVAEQLHEAFRCIHSFKGNCGFMGFADLEMLSHSMETVLDAMRNDEAQPNEENIGRLLELVDVLRDAVGMIEHGNPGDISDCAEYIRTLSSIMDLSLPARTADSGTEKKGSSEATAPQEAKASGPGTGSGGPSSKKDPSAAAKKSVKQDIRVDLKKLDSLINLVGELVIAESMVTRCPAVSHVEDEYYNRAKHQLRRICDDLKDVAMSVRMVPLSATFRKMIRLVHDLATKSGKKIKLNLEGEETEVDKTVIEQIADPLVHIVRNSCDHGVETPEKRVAAGKDETGTVTLEGRHEGGEVWILIKDDGNGLSRERILAKAKERGLIEEDPTDWSDERVFKMIFEPGFSTAEQVTDISGRGVGMDVVRRNIEKLNGRIDISSKEGEGSTFILRIPLTLAIIDGMLVRVGNARYMIPTLSIRESLVPEKKQITITPDGREVLRLREEMLQVYRLYDLFDQKPDSEVLQDGILIVAEDSGRSFALFVDEIIGQQQTVIKGMSDYIGRARGFSGCTILGDGSVSLILDIGSLPEMKGQYVASHATPDAGAGQPNAQDASQIISLDDFPTDDASASEETGSPSSESREQNKELAGTF